MQISQKIVQFCIYFCLFLMIFCFWEKKVGRKILIASGKGGVGKTTVASGLARALALLNLTVCVVDADMGLNNLDLVMGIEDKVVFDLADCMQGKCQIKQAIVKDKKLDNLFCLPAGKNLPMNIVYSFDSIVGKLASIFDFVIVDSPAGKDEGFALASSACREAFVVVTPHIASIRDAGKMLQLLQADDCKSNIKIVVNRVRGDLVAQKEMIDYKEIEKLLLTECVGVLPENDFYNISGSMKFFGTTDNDLFRAFLILAQNVSMDTKHIFDCTSKYKGISGFFRRKFKRL